MDKIRPILAAVKKYHFWVLSLLIALIGLFSWFTASASLTEEFEKNQSSVKSKMTSVQRISGESSHPNADTIKGIKNENEKLKENVKELWKDLYQRQKENVLYWPEILGEDFLSAVEKLSFDEEIPSKLLNRYQYSVRKLVEKLPEIVQARKDLSATGQRRSSGRGMMRGPRRNLGFRSGDSQDEEEESYIVLWNDLNRLYDKYWWETRPISRKVWVTQEDLWVYKNLLEIIARTNEGATGPHNAVVKVIELLEVGSDAASGTDTSNRIFFDGPRPKAGGGRGRRGGPGGMGLGGPGGMGLGRGGPGGMGRGGPGGRGGTNDPEKEKASLMANRYLDAEGEPTGEVTQGGASGGEVVEYKRLPVRMELAMDFGKLSKLLVECANAPLPVEPSYVQINPEKSDTGGRSGGRGRRGGPGGMGLGGPGGMGLGGPGGMGLGGPGGMGMGKMPTFSSSGANGKEESDPAIVRVVIQGIVYIYKPVNEETFGAEGGAEDGAWPTGAVDSNSSQ